MSATLTRIPLERAREIAWEVLALLGPWCVRIEIAGSIRRQRPTCGDVELVCIPKLQSHSVDLFGQQQRNDNLLDQRCDYLFNQGLFGRRYDKNGRPRWGSGLKWATYQDVALDLFPVVGDTAQWGVDFLIRTGPNTFSKRLVTPVEKGGWMPTGMYCDRGALWASGPPDGALIHTPEEIDVFQAIGRPYVEPWDREVP